MDFYLLDTQSEQSLRFPVNPPEVVATLESKTLNFSPLQIGEVEIPRGRNSIRFSWEAMFPGEKRILPYTKNSLVPNALIHQLRTWMNKGSKLRLVITPSPWNIPVFISSFETTHGDAAGDVKYTIALTEWREMLVTERKAEEPTKKTEPAKRDKKATPKTHTVKKDETLWDIARKYTGKGEKWTELWKLNKDKSKSKKADLIYAGEVFTLPSGW